MKYELQTTDGRARRGRPIFDRGAVETPAFMPVGTYGTVKGMDAGRSEKTARRSCRATPSTCTSARQEIMKLHGDLHDFMQWHTILPIPAVSVCSAWGDAQDQRGRRYFRNPINGDKVFPSPEKSMEIQYDRVPTS
ncbi:tRNA-guanine transglycosylase [Serratia ureilytica]